MNKIEEIVGTIGGYPVIWVPEKDVLFCKNTALHYDLINKILFKASMEKTEIPEKNLTVTKQGCIVQLGCLTTSMSNLSDIKNNIKRLKTNERTRSSIAH